jgi:hypothetical protein
VSLGAMIFAGAVFAGCLLVCYASPLLVSDRPLNHLLENHR